ncbi:MAG: hypothetical protein JWN41_968, partial [Thermoleophilia bacterium]|nr:hypothetical protein [Thermoleophilia bacterium]
IATDAVTTTQLLDGTIAAADIGTGAVTTTQILDNTIAATDINTGAVTSAGILNGTIVQADLDPAFVTSLAGGGVSIYTVNSSQAGGNASATTLYQGCPSGDLAISGGAWMTVGPAAGNSTGARIFGSSPNPLDSTQWRVQVVDNNAGATTWLTYATCLHVGP